MNNVFITGHILHHPIRFSSLKYYLTEIKIIFSNIKDKKNTAIGLADGEIGNKIFEFYKKGDYILVEGESLVVQNKEYRADLIICISDIQIINQTKKE